MMHILKSPGNKQPIYCTNFMPSTIIEKNNSNSLFLIISFLNEPILGYGLLWAFVKLNKEIKIILFWYIK